MHHETSGPCPSLQPIIDRRCSSCRAVKSPDDFPIGAGAPAGCCASCRRRSAAVTRRRQHRALRQVARRAEASYRALLAQHSPQGVVAMRPERPECQCLACAQLQHHQANDTLLLFAIAVVVVVGGLVWLVGQVAGLLASGVWPDVPLAELPGILTRLRDHAGDPAAAWPANVRGGLPGPVAMYATLAGILTTPVALGVLAWWLHQPPATPRQPATPARQGHRALPPAEHRGAPMLPPPEHDRRAS